MNVPGEDLPGMAVAVDQPEGAGVGLPAGLCFGWPKAAEPLGGPVKPKLFLAAGTLVRLAEEASALEARRLP